MISRKSVITFGMVAIPIAMYTATQDNDIHFNQLHKEDNNRIRYKKTCAHCGKEVSAEDIVKGFEYDKEKYVVVTDEEKHPGPDSKGVVTMPVSSSSGETKNYFYIESAPGLISEVQMGTLEFHTWGSHVEELEKPDIMVFDLDPDEGMNLDTVRQGVRDIKSILSELSLNSYLKTSGGKGYHVVVPLKPAASWDKFHDFARRVAEVMEQKWPDRYTSNVRKAKRTGKIFIDWIRNGRGATSIAPYSIRARKGAPVSMPIAWDELNTVAPDGINMSAALLRIAGDDPWKGFFPEQSTILH